ncbi:MAG TPA: glycoside hydrolase family 28 protein [Candidatus Ornithomonoglobus merdipullorum]|uniref:Glycoside hydrolase family 28 protein n=1 Tax=Candidatus Ornithomonoglobus merdipullorum TaxID=2840895 RepID=A0A9D1MBS0_9FIRM|nr:glycoside hydrolase family 28 protein [Candidatus Ornithomonoglobus merdipullorum]
MNIFHPVSAVTDSSAAVLYTYYKNSAYTVFVNGEKYAVTDKAEITVRGLEPDTEYEISVRAEAGGINETAAISVRTAPRGEVLDIRDFGAVGDGVTDCTEAIGAAVKACPKNGTVLIKDGVYMSGALFLKSDMTLRIGEDAVLLGSPDVRDYPVFVYRFEGLEQNCYASLINTVDGEHRNIKITGGGVIDANGEKLFAAEMAENAGKRGRAVCIRNTDGVYIEGVTVRQSPAWCVHTIYCSSVTLDNVKIFTKFDENGRRYKGIYNGDGFDPDSCRDVTVFGCTIGSQDDCIAVKSGRDAEGRAVGVPTENVLVRSCRFASGFGCVVGSEMSGSVRNVTFENCKFENTYSLASIKAPRGRGGVVENVVYRNCSHYYDENEFSDNKWFRGAINIDMFYGVDEFDTEMPEPVDEGTPKFRGIMFENIVSETTAGCAVYICGLPESRVNGISFRNVRCNGKSGLYVKNADIIETDDIQIG